MNRQNRKFVFNGLVLLFWLALTWAAAYFTQIAFSKAEWFGLIYYVVVMIYSSYKADSAYDKIKETFKED